MDLIEAAAALQKFRGADLTLKLAEIESKLRGMLATDCTKSLPLTGADHHVLAAAGQMKQVAGQINVVIHALGILLCLRHLLADDERIEYV